MTGERGHGNHRHARSRPYRSREQGGRDWRMLPCAIAVWSALLIEHTTFGRIIADPSAGMTPVTSATSVARQVIGLVLPAGIALMAMIALLMIVRRNRRYRNRRWRRHRRRRIRRRFVVPYRHGIVIVAAMACACVSGGADDLVRSADPIARTVADGGDDAVVIGMATAPMTTAALRDADCQTDVRVQGMSVDRIRSPSSITVRVYASGRSCIFRQGAVYRISGALRQPRFGGASAWLIVDDGSGAAGPMVSEIREPAWWRRAGTAMQESFIRVTRGLPDHGQVLVPGLTLGVLGQDTIMTTWTPLRSSDTSAYAVTADVDEGYAQRLEDDFKQAGIMHLMAVSGSHFVLVAMLTRRLCARFLVPRWTTSIGIIVAYATLTVLVYPSDSVLRAAIMGMGGVACLLAGRRVQALSGLNWTVILTLLIDPALARSYGFALSCTAVYGLVLCGDAVTRFLRGFMPRPVADTMAVTVAAQVFALPVQVMMTPQLPVLAVPANMMVAPFVAFSTIAGLLSLCLSWAVPPLGSAFAWAACLGTLPLERCAMLIGGSRFSAMPWREGVTGAAVVALIELIVPLTIMAVRAMARSAVHKTLRRPARGDNHSVRSDADGGTPYRARYMERAGAWWHETRAMLFERDVGDVQH